MRVARCPVALSLLLSIATVPAAATAVHKCGLADGRVVYQSAECARGERMLGRWEAVPDPPEQPAATPRTASPRGTRARAPVRRRSTPSARGRVDSCAAAKERRDAVERRVGLARTYELLSALQREVYDACK